MNKKFIFVIVLFLLVTAVAGYCTEPLVVSIDITGLRRIEDGAVRSKLSQKINQPFEREKVSEDIQAIYRMGFFDDVAVDMKFYEGGLKLIYKLKEKPTIVKIVFAGNDELTDDKLREKTTLKVGTIADNSLIEDNTQKLKAYYNEEGYYLAQIVPIIKYSGENEVSLTFKITENMKIKIRKLEFIGNKEISTRKLKKVIDTGTWDIFSFFTGSGYLKKDVLSNDVQRIKDLYLDYGYLDIRVNDPKVVVDEKKRAITVVFELSEGQPFKITSLTLTGNKAYQQDILMPLIKIKPGEFFSKSKLTKDMNAVSDYYTEHGYASAGITPQVMPNETEHTVNVALNIEEGKLYHIGRIDISGNTKTRDKVIRREVTINEGDLYDSAKLKRSQQNINNLDFFEKVDLTPKPEPDNDTANVDIKVKDKMTGFINLGGGYSSIDHLIAMVQVTQTNLFGTGNSLKVSTQIGGLSSLYEITYKNPWFLEKPISFMSSIYRTDRVYSTFERNATGLTFGFGKRFADYYSAGLFYKLEKVNVYNVSDTASPLVIDQEGYSTTGSLTPSIARDTRDNYIDPTTGSLNSVYVTGAGLLGSNRFLKAGIESLWFFPFIGQTTFSTRLRYGYGTGMFGMPLPIYERFFVGGISTIRGVAFGDAGPKDANNQYLGGTSQILNNNEIIFPILPELKIKGVYFVDIGTAMDSSVTMRDVKYTTGLGVRWISPFGPIRVEYGYNLRRTGDEAPGRVEFSVGSFF
ncbi:MAG: outer membrane protein assembly factor BamA [Nitrospirae bacterium]|nr:outer membrane protein assembly factor BamA [Nitrospirota bacterium]MBF0533707.1 outer membrane protein assembly factor BamA [Nitrospirota bacterium]MBF0615584.1 outer membrane protein assembly factor BamA [Nitrospirota bacterium]